MTTTIKLVATALLAGGLLTTAGFGLTQNPGDGPPAAARIDKGGKTNALKSPVAPKTPDAAKAAMTEQSIRAALAKPSSVKSLNEVTLETLIAQIESDSGLIVRFDLAAYKRLRIPGQFGENEGPEPTVRAIRTLYETKLVGKYSPGLSLADVLADVLAQFPGRHTYRIRNGQILIGPAYVPLVIPNQVNVMQENLQLEHRHIIEQIVGEPVSLSIEQMPFKEVIKEVRRLTGANIIVNYPADLPPDQKLLVTATFDDVRLYTALEILGDMAGLKLVYLNNVYYLTSPANAEKLQKKVNEELFGREYKSLAVPAGYVTDGFNMYRNPGNLKAESLDPFGILGGNGVIGAVPAPPVPAVKK